MFFMRLRRTTKPVFIFLALVFAASFVFLGVGSGSSGIGDLLRGNFRIGGGSGSSLGAAQKDADAHPNDPRAQRKLATALEQKGRIGDAIVALTRYTELKPKDGDALRELGALYLRQAQDVGQRLQAVQAEQLDASAGQTFAPSASSPLGRALGTDPILGAVATTAGARATTLSTQQQDAYGKAVSTFQALARVAPSDPNVQFELAQAAEAGSDIPTAVAAYKKFVKLAPDDPNAPLIRKHVKDLTAPVAQPTSR